MTNTLLHNESLIKLTEGLKINQEQKDFLISKIPELDLEERIALFKTLTKVYLLDLEKKEVIERVKKFWQK